MAWGCRYEAGKRKGEFSEEECKRKQAKDSIDRYHHYYERFHAHHAARAKAQKELETGRCAADTERMSGAVKVSETQLRFMHEARPSTAHLCVHAWHVPSARGARAYGADRGCKP